MVCNDIWAAVHRINHKYSNENDDDDDEIHNEDNDNDANNDNPKSEEKIIKMLC